MVLLLVQLASALVVTLGWGYWVFRALPGKSRVTHAWKIWCTLGGFAGHALLLQQLWYLGAPVRLTAWLSFAVGCSGSAAGWVSAYRGGKLKNRGRYRTACLIGLLTVLVCGIQGWSLFSRGPNHYFGRGEYDQFNYVTTAQFIVDYSGRTPLEEVLGHPALMKGHEASSERITQSVLNAELAVLSGSDAQQSYGATTLWLLVLMGVSVFGFLRVLGTRETPAVLAVVLVVGLPAVTQVQLNGFLSQTSVYWSFFAVFGVLARGPYDWRQAALAGAFVGFVLGAYTELAPIAWAMGALSAFFAVGFSEGIRRTAVMTLVCLVVNVGYIARAGEFFVSQLGNAQGPNWLATWTPDSGTWKGFGRDFAGELPSSTLTVTGVLIALAVGAAIFSVNSAVRKRLLLFLVVPSLAVGGLLLLPNLPAYAFGKLLLTFTPLFFAAVLVAISWAPRVISVGFSLLVTLVGLAEIREAVYAQRELVQGTSKIAAVDLPSIPAVKQMISEVHPAPVYLLTSEYPLSTAWLAYHLRNETTYFAFQEVSDRSFPSEWHAFRRLPAGLPNVFSVDDKGVTRLEHYDPYPILRVTGATEEKQGMTSIWHSSGRLQIEITFTGEQPRRLRWFCFELAQEISGIRRTVEIVSPNGRGTANSGAMMALPARMNGSTYNIAMQSTDGLPFSVSIFGLEPVRENFQLPYGFEKVTLGLSAPSR